MTTFKKYTQELLGSVKDCEKDVADAVKIIKELHMTKRRLWVLGNGGSMAIAQHFAQDMLKMHGVIAQAINCPSIITAFTNDEDFERCFSLPLGFMMKDGDGIMIFSCSGSSRNYKNVVKLDRGPVISVVGTDGGFLKHRSKVCVHVKHDNYQICETGFSIIADLIGLGMENKNA